MNNKLTKSYWGVESNGKFTDNNSKTLSIILPGIGYLLDRSYLDYSKQLCLQMGYDVLEIEYGFHITRAKFDPSKEFDILMLLIQNPNKVISKEKIFREVWHEDYCIDTQTVTVHIKNIRKKIKEVNPITPTIETVWGIGFKIC